MAETISIFVPLLFLVVTELSSIARGMNLKNIDKDASEPFLIRLVPPIEKRISTRSEFVPQLGYFNSIHGANFAFLALGMFSVVSLSEGTITYVLVTMIWIIWALLPIFEVSEYEEMSQKPSSFGRHALLSTICAFSVVFVFWKQLHEFLRVNIGIEEQLLGLGPILFLILISNQQFLTQLDDEINEIDDDDSESVKTAR